MMVYTGIYFPGTSYTVIYRHKQSYTVIYRDIPQTCIYTFMLSTKKHIGVYTSGSDMVRYDSYRIDKRRYGMIS